MKTTLCLYVSYSNEHTRVNWPNKDFFDLVNGFFENWNFDFQKGWKTVYNTGHRPEIMSLQVYLELEFVLKLPEKGSNVLFSIAFQTPWTMTKSLAVFLDVWTKIDIRLYFETFRPQKMFLTCQLLINGKIFKMHQRITNLLFEYLLVSTCILLLTCCFYYVSIFWVFVYLPECVSVCIHLFVGLCVCVCVCGYGYYVCLFICGFECDIFVCVSVTLVFNARP